MTEECEATTNPLLIHSCSRASLKIRLASLRSAQQLFQKPTERRAKLLFHFWAVCCEQDVGFGEKSGTLMLCARISILSSIFRVLDNFGGNIGGGAAVCSSIYIFVGKNALYLTAIPSGGNVGVMGGSGERGEGAPAGAKAAGGDLLSLMGGGGEGKWIDGGSMKSIVGRLLTAMHTETSDIVAGAIIGSSYILNDENRIQQKDYLLAKEALRGGLEGVLAKNRFHTDDKSLTSLILAGLNE